MAVVMVVNVLVTVVVVVIVMMSVMMHPGSPYRCSQCPTAWFSREITWSSSHE